ncbi:ABC transporter ATP-binding protein [Lachnotalea sp. AF33-28]|uniref:ABC transporter ATP-binding protein n=1 Tax=Lachnotalea sp. AF33-28 TaxID=2292046 RepID=UPI000E4A49A8|nr:ABC transporter ATP-binding protein [Lachnotalea sp. AF33-28]RHP33550.1 ABC transporter ATP-binding protein [Lachnotalea sp. AF33-28]
MEASVVKVENLVKRYKDLLALDHFSLDIREGEIFGLLGPNGSGKTTTINCILSLLTYDKGSIQVFGRPMKPDSYDLKQEIGVIQQNVAVFDELTVYENIYYFCSLYIADKKRCRVLSEEALEFTGLTEYRKFRPKKLSGGLLRRLNIACGIAHKPKLLFMDEPTVAVDPQSRNKILEGIQELNKKGATIVYTSHYMEEVEQIATRIAIMDKGRMLAVGTAEELKSMIPAGETVRIHMLELDDRHLSAIRGLDCVFSADYRDEDLIIQCTRGRHNLMRILEYLTSHDLIFGEVYSQLPTLNDVFLEITGKQLRD